jgi:glutamate/tyrosine decarboxylase-like PLP-dependent enzyme
MAKGPMPAESSAKPDLDPEDWPAFRKTAHAMLDDMLDHVAGVREQPVWRPMPPEIRGGFAEPLPRAPGDLGETHRAFMTRVAPYSVGNLHPRFMGWVHGAGTLVGMLAEMLAGGLNANLGGRDHAPIEVEQQAARWMAELIGFPETSSGLFLTGASMANFVGVLVARQAALGPDARTRGLAACGQRLVAYASRAAHNCIVRAMEMGGFGAEALRLIELDDKGRIDVAAAAAAISADRAAGLRPFLLVGNAGTVDTGAIDDLTALAELAKDEGLHFHVDGACGALGMMSPKLKPKFAGIEQADSVAFDFHKWGQAPYDAGFVLVRNPDLHLQSFTSPAAYLRRETRGLAGGSPWPCDFGPDLSRGFRALKVWFTLKVYGADALGAMMLRTCELAGLLARRIDAETELERLAPVELNIVCFRYRAPDAASDALNASIVVELQEQGVAAPSTTSIDGRLAIRAAIVGHRTLPQDIDVLIEAVLAAGRRLAPVAGKA